MRKWNQCAGATVGGEGKGSGHATLPEGGMVSLRAEVPEPLLLAMRAFIEGHPNWDQYRLFQAALAGFLVQRGSGDRAVTRYYLANLFPAQAAFNSPVRLRPTAQRPHPPGAARWPA